MLARVILEGDREIDQVDPLRIEHRNASSAGSAILPAAFVASQALRLAFPVL